jgi:hypothetical protein
MQKYLMISLPHYLLSCRQLYIKTSHFFWIKIYFPMLNKNNATYKYAITFFLRNILLYYLQVGGYSAENFFEARSNFNEIMLLELFHQGIGLQVCINTSNFCHGATFFCICQLPWILDTRPWLNIYILNSNKSKKNVIAYLYVALFLFNMGKYF